MPLPPLELATAVPLPQIVLGISSAKYLSNFYVPTSVPAVVGSKTIVQKANLITSPFNQNAAYLDMLAVTGGGIIGVIHGLEMTVNAALNIDVSAGTAIIEGIVQKTSTNVVTCNNNATNRIWLKQDGTFEVKTDLNYPSIAACFIGTVVTSGGAISTRSTAGVVYCRCGIAYRETADAAEPQDTPNSLWIGGITKTSGGLYLWNGSQYLRLDNNKLTVAKTANYTVVTPKDRDKVFTNEGAAGQVDFTLPAAASSDGPFIFYVQTAQTLKIIAGAGDTIRVDSFASAAAGYCQSATIGSTVTLVAINATEWVAISHGGTWTIV